jgi:hypothetical protein
LAQKERSQASPDAGVERDPHVGVPLRVRNQIENCRPHGCGPDLDYFIFDDERLPNDLGHSLIDLNHFIFDDEHLPNDLGHSLIDLGHFIFDDERLPNDLGHSLIDLNY